MKKVVYKIRTYNKELKQEQLEDVSGYIEVIDGIKFGYSNRGTKKAPMWDITDIASGLKLANSVEKLAMCPEVAKKHLKIVKDFHQKQYVKEGRKWFIELPLYME